jgi:hypothetical protein
MIPQCIKQLLFTVVLQNNSNYSSEVFEQAIAERFAMTMSIEKHLASGAKNWDLSLMSLFGSTFRHVWRVSSKNTYFMDEEAFKMMIDSDTTYYCIWTIHVLLRFGISMEIE